MRARRVTTVSVTLFTKVKTIAERETETKEKKKMEMEKEMEKEKEKKEQSWRSSKKTNVAATTQQVTNV